MPIMHVSQARRLMVVVVVLAACSSHSSSKIAAGYAPTHVGESYVCLRGAGIAAFDERKQFVPVGFPVDATVTAKQPSRCFESEQEAVAAGYRPLPTPVGAELVDGTYLVAPPSAVDDSCHVAADRLGHPVPCPGLLPSPAGSPQVCPAECVDQDFPWFLFSYQGFVVPAGTVAHLVIAARADTATLQADPTSCFNATEDGTLTAGPRTVQVVLCAAASELNGGHTLARWSEHGVTTSVSVHGHTPHERLLIAELAAAIRFVEPNS